MKPTVLLALFGWPIVSLFFYSVLHPRRALLASVLLGWMFLPVASYKFASGIPEYTKVTATVLGPLLGLVFFDLKRLETLRPSWADLPMVVWCLVPLAASVSNGLGPYDGFSGIYYKTIMWGIPYLFGRLYCSTLIGIRDLAMAIFVGGLVYIPFCLFEIKMSPQLHSWVYGYHQHQFGQSIRFGGWRPTVFMEHGLMVGMWMAMATLSGVWLWSTRALRSFFRVPMIWLLLALFGTTVLCKSLGALFLLMVGFGVLLAMRIRAARIPILVALALTAPLYFVLRIPNVWTGEELTNAATIVSLERSDSLKFRLANEELLMKRASMRPVFGWGGWGRARVRDEMGRDISVTDGLWIIVLGNEGLVGLSAMTAFFLFPLFGLLRSCPPLAWRHPLISPAVAMTVVVLLFFIDCIFNAMFHPAYAIAAGGLVHLVLNAGKRRAKPL
ncbi:MAG: O-antigen ligase domain-containing protein, partial [Planctomycetota bacterium]